MQQRRPGSVIPLTDVADIQTNTRRINDLFFINDLNDYRRANEIKAALEKFARENGISFHEDNLMPTEEDVLVEIIKHELQKNATDREAFEGELLTWKSTLAVAVAGQGDFVAMHAARSSGMVADLINHGAVPQGKWGTDLDVKQCLGRDLTHAHQITNAGTYILPPVSLTESVASLEAVLAEVFDSVRENEIAGNVSVRIPVNCGDQLLAFG